MAGNLGSRILSHWFFTTSTACFNLDLQILYLGIDIQRCSSRKLLNSLPSAPFLTQVRWGWKGIFMARLLVAVISVAATILYKFSFVLVNRQDTVKVLADWVEMGTSPYLPGRFAKLVIPGLGTDRSSARITGTWLLERIIRSST
jgi:hypothetical protein